MSISMGHKTVKRSMREEIFEDGWEDSRTAHKSRKPLELRGCTGVDLGVQEKREMGGDSAKQILYQSALVYPFHCTVFLSQKIIIMAI